MQNSPCKFIQNSFQSSNFVFVHFSPLSFRFIQLRNFCQYLLKLFEKYSSIINLNFFFNLKT